MPYKGSLCFLLGWLPSRLSEGSDEGESRTKNIVRVQISVTKRNQKKKKQKEKPHTFFFCFEWIPPFLLLEKWTTWANNKIIREHVVFGYWGKGKVFFFFVFFFCKSVFISIFFLFNKQNILKGHCIVIIESNRRQWRSYIE